MPALDSCFVFFVVLVFSLHRFMRAVTDSPRHQCFIYEGAPSSHLADIAQTLIEQLNANRRCLYLNSAPMVAGMRYYLSAAGLDLPEQVKRGALILTSDKGHLVEGKFDVSRMVQLLDEALTQALTDKFTGLWASGDMTWEFGCEANLEKLAEYEHRLEDFMVANPGLSGICLYHRDTLPPHAIETALMTHSSLYKSATLSQLNSRYYRQLGKKS